MPEIKWVAKEDYETLFLIGLDKAKFDEARFIAYECGDEILELYKCECDTRTLNFNAIERITIEQADDMLVSDFSNKKYIIY